MTETILHTEWRIQLEVADDNWTYCDSNTFTSRLAAAEFASDESYNGGCNWRVIRITHEIEPTDELLAAIYRA